MDQLVNYNPEIKDDDPMKDPYLPMHPDPAPMGYWILKTMTPVLLLIIGFFVRAEMARFDESMNRIVTSVDRLNDSMGTLNNRTTHVEDAIEFLKERR